MTRRRRNPGCGLVAHGGDSTGGAADETAGGTRGWCDGDEEEGETEDEVVLGDADSHDTYPYVS